MRPSALAILLAACGGGGSTNIKPTLVLADRSDAELARLISAAGGTEMFTAQSSLDQFSDATGPCPTIAVAGDAVTLTGGCTTADSIQIDGSAILTNPTSWSQVPYNYAAETDYELQALALTQSSFTQSWDGFVHISNNFRTYDADLTTTMLGIPLRSDLHFECDASSCDLGGSGLELVGVGGVTVDGTVSITNSGSASFTLHGVDTLTATLMQGCVAWQIQGTSRQKTCP